MAKGLGFNGNFTGKLGNTIGYALKNSSNKVTQGLRIYQPNVTNPRTAAQSNQRMRMLPAVLFYRALSGLLDHSWEGVPYGSKSRQKFMSLAMKKGSGPYLMKGHDFVVPGDYQISSGSLVGARVLDVHSLATGAKYAISSLITSGTSTSNPSTLGAFSRDIINNNPGWQDGDQLTYIEWAEVDGKYDVQYTRIVLDVTSEQEAVDLGLLGVKGFGNLGVLLPYTANEINQSQKYVCFNIVPQDRNAIAGAAIIQSRLNGSVWQRSSSQMWISDSVIDIFFTDDAFEAAVASYEASATTSDSSYYLNQADGEVSVVRTLTLNLTGVTTPDGTVARVKVAQDAEGNRYLITQDGTTAGQCRDAAWALAYKKVDDTTSPITWADLTAATQATLAGCIKYKYAYRSL